MKTKNKNKKEKNKISTKTRRRELSNAREQSEPHNLMNTMKCVWRVVARSWNTTYEHM